MGDNQPDVPRPGGANAAPRRENACRSCTWRVHAGCEERCFGPGIEVFLTSRIRNSHTPCGGYDCEFRVQRGTRITELSVPLDSEIRISSAHHDTDQFEAVRLRKDE